MVIVGWNECYFASNFSIGAVKYIFFLTLGIKSKISPPRQRIIKEAARSSLSKSYCYILHKKHFTWSSMWRFSRMLASAQNFLKCLAWLLLRTKTICYGMWLTARQPCAKFRTLTNSAMYGILAIRRPCRKCAANSLYIAASAIMNLAPGALQLMTS